MTDRTQGILNRASEAEKFSGVRWILGDGVITNYMQSFVDDTMKRNAEFQSRAGVSPKIVRKSPTKCCPWCDALVGTYNYPDDVPDDVYRRHDNCNCIVEFYPGDGKKQDVWSKQWQEAEPETIKKRQTVGLEEENKLRNGLGAEHYDSMQKLVDASDNETAKTAWNKAAPKVEVENANYKGTAHAFTNKISLDADKSASGSYCKAKYSTSFHESGHAIDFMAAKYGESDTFSWYFSSTYKNGLFRDTIKKEVDARVNAKADAVKELFKKGNLEELHNAGLIDDFDWKVYQSTGKWWSGRPPEYKKAKAYAAISKDIRDMGAIRGGDISDIYEGATNGRAHGNMGHGASYWKDKDKLATEAFAEFTSATFCNPESLEAIKEWFPESYKVYLEMLEVIAENGV